MYTWKKYHILKKVEKKYFQFKNMIVIIHIKMRKDNKFLKLFSPKKATSVVSSKSDENY